MASIKLEQLSKTFSGGVQAVCDVELEVSEGERLVLVGPSGCGKTTTLRLIAGLETPSAGRIFMGGHDVTAWPPRRRDLAMVFQEFALYPHQNVRENLAFGLRLRGTAKALIAQRVATVAKRLQLETILESKPWQLSGGQRQRVALGRALARQPSVLLLDEPLSNLDAPLRLQTRAEILSMHQQFPITMLYVTHDQEEALTLGQRLAVMHEGKLLQVGSPMKVYHEPANAFVAGFIGSPPMNFIPGTLHAEDGKRFLRAPGFTLELENRVAPKSKRSEVLLGIRPQDLRNVDPTQGDATARVTSVQPLGKEIHVCLVLPASEGEKSVTMVAPPETKLRTGDCIGLQLLRERVHLFDAATGQRVVVGPQADIIGCERRT